MAQFYFCSQLCAVSSTSHTCPRLSASSWQRPLLPWVLGKVGTKVFIKAADTWLSMELGFLKGC